MKLHIIMMVLLASSLTAQITQEKNSDQKFQFTAIVGFGYRTAPLSDQIPDNFRDYAKNSKYGYSLGAEMAYYVKPEWGLGAKFIQFNSINTLNVNGFNPDGSSNREKIKEKVKITFIGPAYFSRLPFANDRHVLLSSIGIGYISYVDKANFEDASFKVTGGTFGATLDVGYDYKFTKSLSVGVQLGYAVGVLNKLKINDDGTTSEVNLEGDDRENLSFLNVGGGLRLSI